METILVVEDEGSVRQSLRLYLERKGFLIIEAMHGARLFDVLEHHEVDLILLDVMLPDGSGLCFLEDIKKRFDLPVFILSGRSDKADILSGYDAGADDYICKPIDFDVLHARIQVALKRHDSYKSMASGAEGRECIISFHDWVLDRSRFQVFDSSGRSGELTIAEFKVLEFLLVNSGRVIRREELCDIVKEGSYVPSARALDVKIARIRKKISSHKCASDIIKTVRGVGYMLDA